MSADFDKLDVRTIRKFLYHVTDELHKGTSPKKKTVPSASITKELPSTMHTRLETMEDDIYLLKQHIQHISTTIESMRQSLGQSKDRKKKFNKDNKEALKHQLKKLDLLYTKVAKQDAVSTEKLEIIQKRILTIKQKLLLA